MIPLDRIDANLTGPALVSALAGMGLGVGVLTGLFGVGGAFLMNPLMIVVLGIDQSLVVGSSLCFTVGTASAGVCRHLRLRNVEVTTVVVVALGGCAGAVLGSRLHEALRAALPAGTFKLTILWCYLAMLVLTAWVVARRPGGDGSGLSPLQRLPLRPRIRLRQAGLESVSLLGLVGVGLLIGLVSGLLGIGGGVLLMPLMLLVVGLGAHQAVGTGLGVILFSSMVGTAEHAVAGNVSLWIAMPPLVGSAMGVQLGAWFCQRLRAGALRRYFAVVVLLAAVLVAADIARRMTGG